MPISNAFERELAWREHQPVRGLPVCPLCENMSILLGTSVMLSCLKGTFSMSIYYMFEDIYILV